MGGGLACMGPLVGCLGGGWLALGGWCCRRVFRVILPLLRRAIAWSVVCGFVCSMRWLWAFLLVVRVAFALGRCCLLGVLSAGRSVPGVGCARVLIVVLVVWLGLLRVFFGWVRLRRVLVESSCSAGVWLFSMWCSCLSFLAMHRGLPRWILLVFARAAAGLWSLTVCRSWSGRARWSRLLWVVAGALGPLCCCLLVWCWFSLGSCWWLVGMSPWRSRPLGMCSWCLRPSPFFRCWRLSVCCGASWLSGAIGSGGRSPVRWILCALWAWLTLACGFASWCRAARWWGWAWLARWCWRVRWCWLRGGCRVSMRLWVGWWSSGLAPSWSVWAWRPCLCLLARPVRWPFWARCSLCAGWWSRAGALSLICSSLRLARCFSISCAMPFSWLACLSWWAAVWWFGCWVGWVCALFFAWCAWWAVVSAWVVLACFFGGPLATGPWFFFWFALPILLALCFLWSMLWWVRCLLSVLRFAGFSRQALGSL
ncbi:hypothetical protein SAMN03159300_10478 [Janthinobacterium sp. 344]|nr:hypothetical protein SAMN03159300_10478 [Janthinobacterium sp. 344]